ncbi:prenyltransferase [Kitasatospora sp. NPDC057692]|uniref:prenyltransferase n=1 Tax=Kitasatospora sp. NPDC057692 TaxID=3346215 RepID=UPI0036C8FA08
MSAAVQPLPLPARIRAFVRLGRPKFLFQSLLVVGAAVAVSILDGHPFAPGWYAVALAFAWCGHLMTHYCNEFFDLDADRANQHPTSWTGGSRVLVDGLLTPLTSLGAAFVLLVAEIALLVAMPTTAARATGAAIIALAWFYTAPPASLNYRAVGELTCGVVVYGLVPLLSTLLQGPRPSAALLVCAGVLAAQGTLRMLVMNLADIEGDREVGKLTWAGAMGPHGTVIAYGVGQLLCYATLVAALATGVLPPAITVALLAVAPAPAWVALQLARGRITDLRAATAITFWASMQMALGSTAVLIGATAQSLYDGRNLPVSWLLVVGATLAAFGAWLVRTAGRAGAEKHPRPAHLPAP